MKKSMFHQPWKPSILKAWIFILFLLCCGLDAYCDEELDQLWASISDINQPTIEDYQQIENYLHYGKRVYLDTLKQSLLCMGELQSGCLRRLNLIRNFKLIGPDNEMPIFERYYCNLDHSISKRCIVLFSSYNDIYPTKARKLLSELLQSGRNYAILFRIGGFPNTTHGGLKICYVPYAFKAAFLYEAQWLGYKQILWLDTAIHPLTNFDNIFEEIEKRGYFFTSVGTLSDNFSCHLPKAAHALHIKPSSYSNIPHLSSSIIGLNLENQQTALFLENWYKETERIYPNITWFPEELCLSVVAWRKKCKPSCWFGNIVCNEEEVLQLQNRPTVQFYLDAQRK